MKHGKIPNSILSLIFIVMVGLLWLRIEGAGTPTAAESTDDSYTYFPITMKPRIYWGAAYSSDDPETFNHVLPGLQGTFYLLGQQDLLGGEYAFCIARIDQAGEVIWQKWYGLDFWAQNINGAITPGGDLILTGMGAYSGADGIAVKLDPNGNILWQKYYDSQYLNYIHAVAALDDGSLLAVGYVSLDGVTSDLLLLKLTGKGDISWRKSYRVVHRANRGTDVLETSDGGFVVVGHGYEDGHWVAWIVKVQSDGDLEWITRFQDTEAKLSTVGQLSNGTIVAVGSLWTGDQSDVWVLQLDSRGKILSQRSYGGVGDELGHAGYLSGDGSLVVAGLTTSFGAENEDGWLFKLDTAGNIVWQRVFQREYNDALNGLFPSSKGWLLVGSTEKWLNNKRNLDGWAWQVNPNGDIPDCSLIHESLASSQVTSFRWQHFSPSTRLPVLDPLNVSISVEEATAEMQLLYP